MKFPELSQNLLQGIIANVQFNLAWAVEEEIGLGLERFQPVLKLVKVVSKPVHTIYEGTIRSELLLFHYLFDAHEIAHINFTRISVKFRNFGYCS